MPAKPLVVFSHGKETGPQGRKIRKLQEIAEAQGAQTISVDYTSTYDPTPIASHVAAVHGWHDDVVPVDNAMTWARQHNVRLVLVNDNHSLHSEVHTVGQLLVGMLQQL